MTLFLGRTWQSWLLYTALFLATVNAVNLPWWAQLLVACGWSIIVPNKLRFFTREDETYFDDEARPQVIVHQHYCRERERDE